MSREYPDWVDPWKAAEGRRTFSGTMPLNRMKRLLPMLDPPVGDARFVARFSVDEQEHVVIRIEVEAALPLICQRSLERYMQPVHRTALLGVLASLAEEDGLPGHYEPVLAGSGRLALQDLVEDELLLGVPQVPRNPAVDAVRYSVTSAGAGTRDEPEAVPVRKPFANLAERLKQQARSRRRDP